MKSLTSHPLMVLSLAFLAPMSSTTTSGAVLAYDTFEYSVSSPLNGANEGAGWLGAWTASSVASVDGNGAAQFGTGSTKPDGGELAYRTFAPYSGDDLFVAVTISASGHEGNDFFCLWLDESSSVNLGGNHGVSRLNTGMSSGNLFTRLSTNAERTSTGLSVTNGETYRIVVHYSKSVSGADNVFDTVTWWINPTSGDSTPAGTVSGAGLTTLLKSIGTVGFRGASNENSDIYRVHDLVIATTWEDIVPIPEPSTAALTAGGIALAGVAGMRRRGSGAAGSRLVAPAPASR